MKKTTSTRHSTCLILILLAAVCLLVGCSEKGPDIYTPPPGVVLSLDDAILIDVRSDEEHNKAHIEGVLFIPHETIGGVIEEKAPNKDGVVFVHCAAGVRAGMARQTLLDKGYTKVYNLGGMEDAAKKVKGTVLTFETEAAPADGCPEPPPGECGG